MHRVRIENEALAHLAGKRVRRVLALDVRARVAAHMDRVVCPVESLVRAHRYLRRVVPEAHAMEEDPCLEPLATPVVVPVARRVPL